MVIYGYFCVSCNGYVGSCVSKIITLLDSITDSGSIGINAHGKVQEQNREMHIYRYWGGLAM